MINCCQDLRKQLTILRGRGQQPKGFRTKNSNIAVLCPYCYDQKGLWYLNPEIGVLGPLGQLPKHDAKALACSVRNERAIPRSQARQSGNCPGTRAEGIGLGFGV